MPLKIRNASLSHAGQHPDLDGADGYGRFLQAPSGTRREMGKDSPLSNAGVMCSATSVAIVELDRRQREALQAVTVADLASLVADLPAPSALVTSLPPQSELTGFWPASSSECAVKLAIQFGVPATFVTGGVLAAAYADGASDVSQFSWAVGMGVAGYLTHWVVAKFKR